MTGMKTLMYMVLAAFLLSIVVTPLVEMYMVCREKILLSSTVYNSFRAAREASYSYINMRDVDAVVDEEAFLRFFADTFATSYEMDCTNPTANPLQFVSHENTYNDYEVSVDIEQIPDEEGAYIAIVTVTAESEYKFRTRYMRMISIGDTNPYLLSNTSVFTMKITN